VRPMAPRSARRIRTVRRCQIISAMRPPRIVVVPTHSHMTYTATAISSERTVIVCSVGKPAAMSRA
jgi:hypothetical protein